jgi:hypothetical protein
LYQKKDSSSNCTKKHPKLAPELSPKTGPANGFRNKVCINKLLMDNPIQQKLLAMALGRLDN